MDALGFVVRHYDGPAWCSNGCARFIAQNRFWQKCGDISDVGSVVAVWNSHGLSGYDYDVLLYAEPVLL